MRIWGGVSEVIWSRLMEASSACYLAKTNLL
jgi:hypothetical protein